MVRYDPRMRVLLLFAVVAACGSTTGSRPVANRGSGDPAPSTPSFDEVSLERTPCMGLCPVYKLTIARDGTVSFTGNAIDGKKPAAHVSAEGLAQIAGKIDAVKFFDYGPDGFIPREPVCKDAPGGGQTCEMAGNVGCSDTSETIVTVTRGGKAHKVTNAHCEASPLDALEALIDKVAGL